MDETAEEKAEREAKEQAKNEAQKPAPVTVTPEQLAAAEKKAEQAEMRARQLENEKLAREKADEEARNKKLEEDNEWKELAAREKQRADALESAQEEERKRTALKTAESTLLADYSDEVKEIISTTGLSLNDDSETAQAEFKSRLDAIAAKLPAAQKPKVQGNNGVIPPSSSTDVEDAKLYQRMRFDDRELSESAKRTAIDKLPALAEMRKNAGIVPSE